MRDLALGASLFVLIALASVLPFLVFGVEMWVAPIWLAWFLGLFWFFGRRFPRSPRLTFSVVGLEGYVRASEAVFGEATVGQRGAKPYWPADQKNLAPQSGADHPPRATHFTAIPATSSALHRTTVALGPGLGGPPW